ncbi:TIGR01777 family oxidoreductase [Alteromonas hispanica]|uniref:TIGR01777 family protein n=1 Tax=Alteromonas hispanica TaxID=315421 RepID=A0A6L9MRV5_9ALTE|nr:TIGR01777 family oxidoreductase [Alteromonas hispanica]NDW20944.1 TIGR01777 family protein [Alteromonas hispanica]
MNILITGGTGLIGSSLIKKLKNTHSFTVLTRNPNSAQQSLGSDIKTIESVSEIDDIGGFDAVINLAGEPIADTRWTDTQKKIICDSRWDITTQLVAKMNSSRTPVKTFISGSAIGYYGRQGDKIVTEDTPVHKEFTQDLCEKWENIAMSVNTEETRVATLRTGVVLSKNGGALEKMALPFKLGVGGSLGSGKQYLSWIHLDDMVSGIEFLLNNDECKGPFNLTAPEPVTNKTFSKQLAKALSRPCLFFVPSFVMKIAMGESSTMLLEGQNVIPDKLVKAGFTFEYPTVDKALAAIYS